ncbi:MULTISPECIES: hypothetical protein [Gordonia]|uniref:hypothetical protein n=1 Tax=Gordonia TaxID=2053 RepID=UPI00200AF74A|nr:hypothetical protein [Gordonia terrae]UPW08476.1 hypothetical protein M1C59_20860 [Gordonia terrae]
MTTPDLGDSGVFVVDDGDLGRIVALHFVRAGSQRIGILTTDETRGQELAQEVFGAASGIWAISAAGDLTSPRDARRMVAELSGAIGEADVVVDLPGGTEAGHIVREEMLTRGEGVVVEVGPRAGRDHRDGVTTCTVVAIPGSPAELADSLVTAVLNTQPPRDR